MPTYTVKADQHWGWETVGYKEALGGLEGVYTCSNKVLISTCKKEAHDAMLQEVLACLHVGTNGSQPHDGASGQQRVLFWGHIPAGSTNKHNPPKQKPNYWLMTNVRCDVLLFSTVYLHLRDYGRL